MPTFEAYAPLCEVYNDMAQKAYAGYLEKCSENKKMMADKGTDNQIESINTFNSLRQMAISCIIFEALAIEDYVNFWGAYYLKEKFYTDIENGEKKHSTLDKLKILCKSKDDKKYHYPTGGVHYRTLKNLFDDRNRLVHSKPHKHTISGKDTDGYGEMGTEITFIFDNLDEKMKLYDEVKRNMAEYSGRGDAIEDYGIDCMKSILNAITDKSWLY